MIMWKKYDFSYYYRFKREKLNKKILSAFIPQDEKRNTLYENFDALVD